MKFIMMHKADPRTEADVPPSPEEMSKIGALMEDAFKTGVFVAGEGLRPSSERVRLKFSAGKRTLEEGPFLGRNELFAGFAMLKVSSMQEAIEWASRFAEVIGDVEMELGPVTEPWDVGMCPKPEGELPLRVLAMHKANAESERGAPPSPKQMEDMGKLIEQLAKAGVFLAAEGLGPSSRATRVKFAGGKRQVLDGPFAESKELIAGYAIMELPSKEEAINWAIRFADASGTSEIDIRPLE